MPADDLFELDSGTVFDFDGHLPPPSQSAFNWTAAAQAASKSRQRWWSRVPWRKLMPRADWLISFILHSVVLIVLAFFSVGADILPSGVLLISQPEAEGPELAPQVASVADELEMDSISFESIVAQTEQARLDEDNLPQLALDNDGLGAINAQIAEQALASLPSDSMVAGRTGTAKLSLLSKYGGTAKTEAAVKLGLEWLVRQQQNDGWWSFTGPYTQPASFGENSKAATGLALIAFLGAGHTHQSGDYRQTVQRGVEWLAKQQHPDGSFVHETPTHHAIYTQGICTLALSEAYAMTGDTWLKSYAEKAVKYTLRAQASKGGWRYEFRSDSDTSVTGWCMMALVSAKAAGIDVPETNLRRIHAYLNLVDSKEHSQYAYSEGSPSTAPMTAEGILCRLYLGWPNSHPSVEKSAQWLEETAPFKGDELNYYYWYYATQVMHHVGNDHWKQWNTAMREQLPRLQVKEGPEVGSWPPAAGGIDQSAGRLYSTCMALFCLEVYYRHLPLYDNRS